MTVEELSEIYYINKEIEKLQTELYDLKNNKNFYKGNIITDMPRGGTSKDIFVEYTEDIRTVESMIQYSLKKLQLKRKEIEEFLGSIEDAELRLIMRLRAVNGMRWEDIGNELGYHRTIVSRKFYHYFKVAHKTTQVCDNLV